MASRRHFAGPFASTSRAAVPPQYVFFGGKGGTGKTTCAAAAAIALAEQGRKLLVVSTDPAHSLGDVLGRKLTARPSQIRVRHGRLSACELDADRALVRWLAQRRPALAAILERGTILARADIEPFLDLSLPGIDELLGLVEIERLAGQDAYDCVVIDTAPTGHTLRLLATPAIFTTFARVLDTMQEKHRVLAAAFGPGVAGDGSEALIEELERDGDRLGALLRDRSRTRLSWILLPEEMSVAESSRAIAALRAGGIHVSDIIINRLTPPPPLACALCDGRRRFEAEWVKSISTQWRNHGIDVWTLPAREEPPQEIAALREVAGSVSPLGSSVAPRRERRARKEFVEPAYDARPAPIRPTRSTRLLIVGGKGGVGKTTCAAALALGIADNAPDRRVLLVSTDPAHSIGDVLRQRIGNAERRIREGPANLVAREIDAAREWHERREQYRDAIGDLFEMLSAGSHVDLAVDRAIVEELFELAPPGMDEVVSMLTILEALLPRAEGKRAPFDLVIVDSAPTGHTLRLLALPVQAQAWVRQLMAVVLKYKAVAGFEQVARQLLWLSRGLRRLQTLLTNARSCGFITVTRPEFLPAVETIRLIQWLAQHRISRRALIINGITPPGCTRCRRTALREGRQITSFLSHPVWRRNACLVVLTDAVAPPPQKVGALKRWERTWRINADTGRHGP